MKKFSVEFDNEYNRFNVVCNGLEVDFFYVRDFGTKAEAELKADEAASILNSTENREMRR